MTNAKTAQDRVIEELTRLMKEKEIVNVLVTGYAVRRDDKRVAGVNVSICGRSFFVRRREVVSMNLPEFCHGHTREGIADDQTLSVLVTSAGPKDFWASETEALGQERHAFWDSVRRGQVIEAKVIDCQRGKVHLELRGQTIAMDVDELCDDLANRAKMQEPGTLLKVLVLKADKRTRDIQLSAKRVLLADWTENKRYTGKIVSTTANLFSTFLGSSQGDDRIIRLTNGSVCLDVGVPRADIGNPWFAGFGKDAELTITDLAARQLKGRIPFRSK